MQQTWVLESDCHTCKLTLFLQDLMGLFPKFKKKKCAKLRWFGTWNCPFFLKIGISMGGTSNFPAAQPWTNQCWVPPGLKSQKSGEKCVLSSTFKTNKL